MKNLHLKRINTIRMNTIKNEHLYIKNMVCPRCIQSVKEEAIKAGFKTRSIKLGEIILFEKFTENQFNEFKSGIEKNGFELITNKRERIVETIKTEIINMVQYDKKVPGNQNFSSYLSSLLGKDYSYLSSLFSLLENTTIEKYTILQKIERTKELLTYEELSLTEITLKLGYSNTQHLSAQFKKITGITPSQFKKQKEKSRNSLDEI